MNKKILEELRDFKQTIEMGLKEKHGYENCVVKNVIHYNKKVELINKRTKQKEQFDLCTVIVEDPKTKQETIFYYLNGKELDYTDLIKEYESPGPIRDLIENTRKNKEKPDDLNELEKEEKEEKDEEKIPTFKTDKSGATSLDQMIDGVTLRNILKLDSDYECIKPVSVSKIKGYAKGITSKDAVVAIKKNGECTILDENIIRQDRQEGNNSFDKDLNINNDGSVEYKSNTSSYQIVNRPGYYISIGYDEGTSNKEIKISKRSGREGDREVEFELHKYGAAEYEESDARKLRQENEDGIEKSEVIDDKQKVHEKLGCKNEEVENIDNYVENNLHEHIEITKDSILPGEEEKTIEQWAEELGENVEVIIERLKKEINDDPERDLENIVDEIEYDYGMFERTRDRN